MKLHRPIIGLGIAALGLMCGCQSRPCNSCVSAPPAYSTWTGIGNARIAAPATGSFQTASANQPYYAPQDNNVTASGLPAIPPLNPSTANTFGNPNTTYPGYPAAANATPAGYTPTSAGQPGWRPAGDLSGSTSYPATSPSNSGGLAAPTLAAGTIDFRTTTVDERLDPTRLPVNDAMAVRAPTTFTPSGNWQALGPSMAYQPINVQGQIEYRATPQMSGYGMAYNAGRNPASYYGNQATAVLAQASTSPELMAADPNYQAGWRDRNTAGMNLTR